MINSDGSVAEPRSRPVGGGKALRTRQSLLEATLAVIAETGEFTGELVAERAGVSTATFYSHFGTKDHAIQACLAQAFELYEERMREVESVERLLDAGLRETMTAIVATITTLNDDYRSVMRLARGRIQASRLLREQSRDEQQRAFAATRRFIELGQASGRIRRDDPELLTATVRTIVEGLDAWTVRSHPDVAATQVPDVLTRYLTPDSQEKQ